MRNRKYFGVGAIALAGTLLLLAGCSSGTDSTTGSKSGGSITVAAGGQGVAQLNPVISTMEYEEILYPLLWNGLVKYDQNKELVADLATSSLF